jgi:RNA polymerase sigma factor (sigma-70 family)
VPTTPPPGPDRVDAEDVCRRYGAAILRRCRGILKDAAEAEDVAQEVFVTLLTKGGQFRGEAQVASWVYRITTNHCLNRLRAGRRRGAREQADQVVAWIDVAPINPYEHVSTVGLLEVICAELEPLDQQIFIYRYLDDLQQEEIATLVGRTRRTVYTRLKHIEQVAQEKAREAAS